MERKPVKLVISQDSGELLTSEHAPIRVAFENQSDKTVSLLRTFNDEKTLPVWFSVKLVSKNGTPVSTGASAGKISIRGKKKYFELEPSEGFYFPLDLAKMVPDLKEETYNLTIEYHNQYGEDCFKGVLTSNEIQIAIAAPEKK